MAIASLTVLAVSFTGVTLFLTMKQVSDGHQTVTQVTRQAVAAENTYVATTRAWLDVVVKSRTLSIKWNSNDSIDYDGQLVAKNYGTGPSFDSLYTVGLYLFYPPGSLDGIAKRACADADTTKSKGSPIFPQKDATSDFHRTLNQSYSASFIKQLGRNTAIGMVLGSCNIYRIVGDEKIHHIGRAYWLGKPNPDVDKPYYYLTVGESVSADKLAVIDVATGDYAD